MKDANGRDFRWAMSEEKANFLNLVFLRRNGRRLSRPELRAIVGESTDRAVRRDEFKNGLRVYVDSLLGVKYVVNDDRGMCVAVYDNTETEWTKR